MDHILGGERTRPRGTRILTCVVALLVASLLAPTGVAAIPNQLSDGQVSPSAGTHQTRFTFRVHYFSDQGRPALNVVAEAAGATIGLALAIGTDTDGTYVGSSALPAGSWQVTFRADATIGLDPVLLGPTVAVVGPTPIPTPQPPPPPPPTPIATPLVTPLPPAPPAPDPTPGTAPTPGPSAVADPTSSPVPTPLASEITAPPTPRDASPVAARGPTHSAAATPESAPAAEDEPAGGGWGRGPLLVLGSGLSAAGLAVLAIQWLRVRRERHGGR